MVMVDWKDGHRTLGYMVSENPNGIVIATSMRTSSSKDPLYTWLMDIPREKIQSIRTLVRGKSIHMSAPAKSIHTLPRAA